jgi:flagellar basal body-associated protein FliL
MEKSPFLVPVIILIAVVVVAVIVGVFIFWTFYSNFNQANESNQTNGNELSFNFKGDTAKPSSSLLPQKDYKILFLNHSQLRN